MKRKQGISLIILVITIIVMIILASAVIMTLANNGIIFKAETAISAYDVKQVETMANILLGEAKLENKNTDKEQREYVREKLKAAGVNFDKVIVNIYNQKLEVKANIYKKNKYGFYFDQIYLLDDTIERAGIEVAGFVFKENSTIDTYIKVEGSNKIEYYTSDELNYEEEAEMLNDWFSDDGYELDYFGYNATCLLGVLDEITVD